jgi:nitronate monooxygenase
MSVLDSMAVPIVQAPMAGGPSTPALVAAVGAAGGLGFLGAGYLAPSRLADDIAAVRRGFGGPFGVNVFVADPSSAPRPSIEAFVREVAAEAARAGVEPGLARFDDDGFDAKIDLLCDDPVPVVSFTFGPPPATVVHRLRAAGSEVWVTVTTAEEALAAEGLAPDALVVQGTEAGGHRAITIDDDTGPDLTLLVALQLIAAVVDRPLVAAGGLATGAAIAAVLVAGAAAAQLGTAYLCCPEAGTAEVHRRATVAPTRTVLTRAFSGRTARGIENRFHRDHAATAPRAYPEVHHLTAPLRAHGRATGDPDVVNLWAGQAHELARAVPAADLTRTLADDARHALADAGRRLAERRPRPAPG